MVDRIRRASTRQEFERVADDLVTTGYDVLSRGENTIKLRQNNGYGSLGAHIIIALFTIWWTFGVGNLLYGLYIRYSGETVLLKLDQED